MSEESQGVTLQDLLATRDRLQQEVQYWASRDWWLPFKRRYAREAFARAQAELGAVEHRIVAQQAELRREREQRQHHAQQERERLQHRRERERLQQAEARERAWQALSPEEQLQHLAERMEALHRTQERDRGYGYEW